MKQKLYEIIIGLNIYELWYFLYSIKKIKNKTKKLVVLCDFFTTCNF